MSEVHERLRSKKSIALAAVIAAVIVILTAIAVAVALSRSDDKQSDSADIRQMTSLSRQQKKSESAQGSDEQPQQPQAQAPQQSTDIPAMLRKADASCNPHTAFNADATGQESLVLDEQTRSLTLLSGARSDFTTFDCVANTLHIPSEVVSAIKSKQDQPDQLNFTWDGLSGTWSYNVNSGLNLYVVQQ